MKNQTNVIDCYCVIVNHLCEKHGPETLVLGPFPSQASAQKFADEGTKLNPNDDARVEPLSLNADMTFAALLGGLLPPSGPIM